MLENQPSLLTLVAAIGLVGMIPLIVVSMTGFLKISLVLFLIRNALGVQQMPPNLVIYAIALILTLFVTAPLLAEVSGKFSEQNIAFQNAAEVSRGLEIVREPLKRHLLKFTREEERTFFLNATRELWPEQAREDVTNDDLTILVPAFVASELTRAFEIGFILYLPFLIVDLVVANVLMTLGMIMVSPAVISTPLKLFLFVAVSGWSRLMHGLVLTYN